MNAVYIVIENGTPYPIAYTSYATAVAVVQEKHKDILDEEREQANGLPICSEVDSPENKLTGTTELYVEKGIHIYIYKLPILSF